VLFVISVVPDASEHLPLFHPDVEKNGE
jgi:hypothetical protein